MFLITKGKYAMEKITMDTKFKDAIKNPMAKDMIEKLFLVLRLPFSIVENGFAGNLRMRSLVSLSAGLFTKKTVQSICDMFNLEKNEILTDEGELKEKWWKEAVIYQIYPRSFYDSNGRRHRLRKSGTCPRAQPAR